MLVWQVLIHRPLTNITPIPFCSWVYLVEGVGPCEVQGGVLEQVGEGALRDPLQHEAHQLLMMEGSRGEREPFGTHSSTRHTSS